MLAKTLMAFLLLVLTTQLTAQSASFYVRQRQYRFESGDPRCAQGHMCSSVIQHGQQARDYSLNFIEFKDNGAQFDERQLVAVEKQLKDARANDGKVIVFIYIHGWHNNADDQKQPKSPDCSDSLYKGDVAKFQSCGLKVIADNYPPTSAGAPPRVVGIYLAWHGEDFGWIPFYYVPSYIFRRGAARHVGLVGMAKALKSIFDVIEEQRDSYFVVGMGHSFGARALEAADEVVADEHPDAGIVKKIRLQTDSQGLTNPNRLPLDMILYVNAATSHSISRTTIKEWHENCGGSSTPPPGCGQNPLYLAISSRADVLTAIVMPIANTIFFSPLTDQYHIISAANTPWMQTHKIPRRVTDDPPASLPSNAFCFAVQTTNTQKELYEVDPKLGMKPSAIFWAMDSDRWIASVEGMLHKIPVLRKTVRHNWVISSHGDVWNTGVFNMVRAVIDSQQARASGRVVSCRQDTNGQKPALLK